MTPANLTHDFARLFFHRHHQACLHAVMPSRAYVPRPSKKRARPASEATAAEREDDEREEESVDDLRDDLRDHTKVRRTADRDAGGSGAVGVGAAPDGAAPKAAEREAPGDAHAQPPAEQDDEQGDAHTQPPAVGEAHSRTIEEIVALSKQSRLRSLVPSTLQEMTSE